MEAVIKVWKVRKFKKGSLLGFATVLVADVIVVNGIRICEGKNGRFISMPQRKVKDEYKDICYPFTKELRARLQAEILSAYEVQEAKESKQ